MTSILKADTIQDAAGNNIINENANTITIGASGDTVTSPGLTLSDNLLFNAASKGVYLGVTSATASNLLDDYEEGTWTPVVNTANGFSTGITSSSNNKYTKIGNLCNVQAYFQMGNSSGNLALEDSVAITGIPFTAANTEASSCCAYRYNSNNGIFAVYLNATSSIFCRCQQVNGSALRNGGSIALNYTYQTA